MCGMTLREKSRALPVFSLHATLGVLGFSRSSKVSSAVKGLTKVAICVSGFCSKQSMSVCICSGWMNGSSPCILMITVVLSFCSLHCGVVMAMYASRHRSVPQRWSVRVITTLPSNASTALYMRSSSVATSRVSSALLACSYTRCMTVLWHRLANGLPGKRVDAYRAGIIPMYFILRLFYLTSKI